MVGDIADVKHKLIIHEIAGCLESCDTLEQSIGLIQGRSWHMTDQLLELWSQHYLESTLSIL